MIKRGSIRGGALWLTVLVTLLLITYFIGAILSSGKIQSGAAVDARAELQARYAALGAINKAFVYLESNPNWTGSWDYEQMPQNPDIYHSLDSDRSREGLGSDEIYLFAQGYTTQHGQGTPLAAVAGTAYRPSGGLTQACYSDGLISLEGCTVDSYDAGLGMGYVLPDPNATPTPTPTPTAVPTGTPTPAPPSHSIVLGRAHLGSNTHVQLSTTNVDGDIILPQVRRRVDPGAPDQPVDLDSVSSSYRDERYPLTGVDLPEIKTPFPSGSGVTIVDSATWPTLPSPDPPSPNHKVLPPGAYGTVTVPDGATLILQPGEYYFEDGFYAESVTNRITLKLQNESAETKMFVGGEMRLAGVDCRPGDQVTTPISPGLLKIYGGGVGGANPEDRTCIITLRDSNISGAIVGQSVEAEIENCEIWGAILARRLFVDSTTFHYDVSLSGVKLSDHSFWKLRGLTEVNTTPPSPTPSPPAP